MSAAGARFGKLLRGFAMLAFAAICLLMTVGIVNRFFPVGSMGWADELIELLLVWTIFAAITEVWRQGLHFRVTILPDRLRGRRAGAMLEMLLMAGCAAFLAALAWQAWTLFEQASDVSPIFSWSRRFWYAPLPLAGAIMFGMTLLDLIAAWRRFANKEST